ncbi:hypothetical protein Tco_1108810 [Tanacetum coccineum]
MLCYLTRIELYYIQCIMDGPIKPKMAEDDIIESVISCKIVKATWTDLVDSFKGPFDTMENRIMDMKLEYQTFRANSSETLSQTYTLYKTLLNELANDGVTLSKHKINVDFMNSLPEKWLSFSHGLRNANHTKTLDLADIYGRFDFQKNSDDETDERSSEEYLRDLDIEFHERALEQIPNQKNKILGGEQLIETSSLNEVKENPFIPASLDYDHKMVPKSKDWVNKLNPDSKLPNFNTGRILVPESQVVNECLQLTKASADPESSKESGSEPQTSLPSLKSIQEASSSSKVRGGVFAESSQSNESSIGVSYTTCGSSMHYATDHNDFDHFKRGKKLQATKAKEPTKSGCSRSITCVKSYLHKYVEQPGPKAVFGDNSSCITEGYGSINCGGIIFSKQGTIFNANKEIMLISPRRNDGYVLNMSSLTPNGAFFFAKASKSSVSGPVTIYDTELVTSSVPTKVKTNDQESKINELTKLVQMLMDEKINFTQKTQEPKSMSSQSESSKSVNSSKQSQDSKPNGKKHDSSK